MTPHVRTAVLALAAAALLLALAPTGAAISQELTRVFVTNFPDVQRVSGDVGIKGPVRLSAQTSLKEITVAPVSPKDTTRLIAGGTLVTDGFANVVLSLTGQIKGEVYRPGIVGALLIPDEEPVSRAFDEKGQMQFALEVSAAGVSAGTPYFASSQPRFNVAFPRYKVWFYNTSDKTVTVNLYAYLTN